MRKQTVYCPYCAREIYKFDGKHSSQVNLGCKCGKYFRYDPTKNKIVLISRPERTTASGARFW